MLEPAFNIFHAHHNEYMIEKILMNDKLLFNTEWSIFYFIFKNETVLLKVLHCKNF